MITAIQSRRRWKLLWNDSFRASKQNANAFRRLHDCASRCTLVSPAQGHQNMGKALTQKVSLSKPGIRACSILTPRLQRNRFLSRKKNHISSITLHQGAKTQLQTRARARVHFELNNMIRKVSLALVAKIAGINTSKNSAPSRCELNILDNITRHSDVKLRIFQKHTSSGGSLLWSFKSDTIIKTIYTLILTLVLTYLCGDNTDTNKETTKRWIIL